MSDLLELTRLTTGYDGVPTVRGLDLHVGAGEVVALLGANGAGKTSTLLAIAGLLPAISGDIRFAGESIVGVSPQRITRRGIALVPDDRALFFGLTVRENLSLANRRGRAGLAEVLEQFPALPRLLARPAGLLSGGEQQMLAIARALLLDPKVLLIDEMSLGLAPVIVDELLVLVRRLVDDHGVGVLLVEQHIPLILGVADRVYVLANGTLTLEGDPALVAASASSLEASYLGAHPVQAVGGDDA